MNWEKVSHENLFMICLNDYLEIPHNNYNDMVKNEMEFVLINTSFNKKNSRNNNTGTFHFYSRIHIFEFSSTYEKLIMIKRNQILWMNDTIHINSYFYIA